MDDLPETEVKLLPSEIIQAAMTDFIECGEKFRSAADYSFGVVLSKLEDAYAYAKVFLDPEVKE